MAFRRVRMVGWWLILVALLACPGADAKGGAKEMNSLHRDLFTEYNPLVRPSHDYSLPTEVNIGFYISVLLELDTRNQLMKLRGFFTINWIDHLLKWEPEKYGGIDEIYTTQSKVWKPDILIHNSATDNMLIGDEQMFMSILSNGRVKWEPPIYLCSTCNLDMSKYPFDVSICPINVWNWMSDNKSVRFNWTGDPIHLEKMLTNGELLVSSAGAKIEVSHYDHEFFDNIVFLVRLERRPTYVALSMLLPVNLLAIIGILSFAMPNDAPEKINISITVLLSFAVFLTILDNHLPPTSHNICWLLIYVSSLVVLSFLTVIGNILLTTVTDWEESGGHMTKHNMFNHRSFCVPGSCDSGGTNHQDCSDVQDRDCHESSAAVETWPTILFASKNRKDKAAMLNKAFLLFSCSFYVVISFGFLIKCLL